MNHRRLAVVMLAVFALSGCGGGAPANRPASSAAAGVESAASASPAPESGLTKEFGSTFTWNDGGAITVEAPRPFEPSGTAAKQEAEEYVVMDVTLVNATEKLQSPALWTVRATSGDEEASAVLDIEKGVDFPVSDILPGKQRKYKIAFGRKKDAEFVVQVRYGFDDSGYYK